MIRSSVILFFACFVACKNPAKNSEPVAVQAEASHGFFPVTGYLRGQIAQIKSSGVNPLKIDSANGNIDSTWLKIEDLETAFKDYLEPEIDSITLARFYTEDKFADETLGTYTFTYTALPTLPLENPLKRWDLYISQETSNIKSIYFLKQYADRELQLTWQNNQSCKKVTIATDKSGRQFVASEQIIKWNFE
jgi:hypothetical protein